MPATRAALILGCGYVGLQLARRLCENGTPVIATTSSAARRAELSAALPLTAHCVSFDDQNQIDALLVSLPRLPLEVYCLLPPKALASTAQLRGLLEIAGNHAMVTAVLTSSTGIYDLPAGTVVSAETAIAPSSPRAVALATIETAWLTDERRRVVRFAGLYGPGRVIGEAALRAGQPIPGDPSHALNLLETGDAVALLLRCTASERSARIELGSDGAPAIRGDYYRFVAKCLGARPPRFALEEGTRSGDKRCDPTSTMRRLNWAPRYPSYREGVRAALAPAVQE